MDIEAGYYDATCTAVGLVVSKNKGAAQLGIEMSVHAEKDAEGNVTRAVRMTKFGGLEGEGLQYTLQDAENVGCTGDDVAEFEKTFDPNRVVRVHVIHDDYGAKLKSIFGPNTGGAPVGFLINQNRMDEEDAVRVAREVNAKMKAIRAQKANEAAAAVAAGGAAMPVGAKTGTPKPAPGRVGVPRQQPPESKPAGTVPVDPFADGDPDVKGSGKIAY